MPYVKRPLKAGELIVISNGSYSDYCICGHFKILKDCDLAELKEQFIDSLPLVEDKEYGRWVPDPTSRLGKTWERYNVPIPLGTFHKAYFELDAFQAHLMREGYVQDLDVTEFNAEDGFQTWIPKEKVNANQE